MTPSTSTIPLSDIQNSADARGVAIERVGVTGVKFPLHIPMKPLPGSPPAAQTTSATCSLFVGLPHYYKGANLSRFVRTLVEYTEGEKGGVLSAEHMPRLLELLCTNLGSTDAYARFEFDYFIPKAAPVSKLTAPQAYRCAFTGIRKAEDVTFVLEVNVTAASVCPCSREMSLLDSLVEIVPSDGERNTPTFFPDAAVTGYYEFPAREIAELTTEERILARSVGMGAHNQRSQIRVRVTSPESTFMWIEDLVDLIEGEASAPTYPILKREDEKFVTEYGYNHAKFSEDILRDIQLKLEETPAIDSWSLKVRNEESIHGYDVSCLQKSPNWQFE